MRTWLIIAATVVSLAVPADAVADGAQYTVRAGDSLWSIAEQHEVSIRDLVEANGIAVSHTIHPGDSLLIPGLDDGDAPSGASEPRSTGNVTVRAGDSLWAIAERAGVGLRSLLAASGLTIDSVIHPGQTITMPGGGSAPVSPARSDSPSATPTPSSDSYTVRAGDGFTIIARRLGVTTTALLDANGLSRTAIIHPGQRLAVPEQSVPREIGSSASLRPTFERAATEADVSPDLLMAVAFVESRWSPSARSPDGAIGVGQLMPSTAAWIARDLIREPSLDPTDATDNIRMSAHLLAWLLDEGGTTERALAMYLQGVYGVQANGVSASGATYAAKVDAVRPRFR